MAERNWLARCLDAVERAGNRLPDPAVLFLILMVMAWVVSNVLARFSFVEIDPRSGQPIEIRDLLAGQSLTAFMATMVSTFTSFPPLGVVLVAMLGLGVAEHSGFINATLRAAMAVTPRQLLTPALIAVGILSHVAVDAGYVLVIPLGAVIFYAAGRHPLAGIAAAFAGVSGGFSATMGVPSSLDPLLAGLTKRQRTWSTLASSSIHSTIFISRRPRRFSLSCSAGRSPISSLNRACAQPSSMATRPTFRLKSP